MSATDESGCCANCGYDGRRVSRVVFRLYGLGSILFLTTALFSALVFALEMEIVSFYIHPLTPPPALPYIFLAAAVLAFGVVWSLSREMHRTKSMERIGRGYMLQIALCELMCIAGLGLYFAGGSIEWFVTFLGLGWMAFIFSGSQLPGLVRRMHEICADEIKPPGESRDPAEQ